MWLTRRRHFDLRSVLICRFLNNVAHTDVAVALIGGL